MPLPRVVADKGWVWIVIGSNTIIRLHVPRCERACVVLLGLTQFLVYDNELCFDQFCLAQFIEHIKEPKELFAILALAHALHGTVDDQESWKYATDLMRQAMNGHRETAFVECLQTSATKVRIGDDGGIPFVLRMYLGEEIRRAHLDNIILSEARKL